VLIGLTIALIAVFTFGPQIRPTLGGKIVAFLAHAKLIAVHFDRCFIPDDMAD
jgi:hypothetical protein